MLPLHDNGWLNRATTDRGKADGDALSRAIAAGVTTPEILEPVAECTFAGLVGTLDNLAGRVELDEFLKPRAWN